MANVNLSWGRIQTLATMMFVDGNTFQSIDVSFNKLSAITDNTFSRCRWLKTIYANNNVLTTILSHTFADIPTIEEIFLNSNLIDSIVPNAFINMPELKSLHLQNNRLVSLGDSLFSKAPKYLDLSSNQLVHIGGAFNDAIKLVYLNLDNNTELHNVNLNALSELFNLNEISLNGTGFYFQKRMSCKIFYGTLKRQFSNVKNLNLMNEFMAFKTYSEADETLNALATVFPLLETLHLNITNVNRTAMCRIFKLKTFYGPNEVINSSQPC